MLGAQLLASQPSPLQVLTAHVLMVDVSGEHALLQVKRNAVRGILALATTLTVNSWFLAQDGGEDTRSNVEIQNKVSWETGCKVAHSQVYAHSKTTKAGLDHGVDLHCLALSRLNSKNCFCCVCNYSHTYTCLGICQLQLIQCIK